MEAVGLLWLVSLSYGWREARLEAAETNWGILVWGKKCKGVVLVSATPALHTEENIILSTLLQIALMPPVLVVVIGEMVIGR